MLRVRLLGELALERDGEPLPLPARAPARSLLGWLALHPGRHARSTVAGTLWPNVREDSARVSLRSALSALRAALGPAAAALAATRNHVALVDVWVDVREFDRLCAEEPAAALALCRGPLLRGLDDDWVLTARDAHRARESEVLRVLAQRADADTAVALTRRRAELDAFDEPAHRDLMRQLTRVGDRAGALAAYGRLSERLRRELGVPPSAPTRELAAQLRSGTERRAGVAPPAPALPARLAAARRRAPLAGRGAELARLHGAGLREERLLALVTGEPGIGKTRLLAELAATLHADGALVLYGRAEEEALIPYGALADALADRVRLPELAPAGLGEPDAPARFFERVAAALDAVSGGRPLALLLDDLHWADAGTARLVAHLGTRAGGAPRLLVLAYRETDLADGHPLRAALTRLRRDLPAEHVALHGLDHAGVAALVRAARVPGLDVDALLARTGGNPFFVEELVHAGPEAAPPESVVDAVARRVRALGSNAHAVLVAGAVAGAEFDAALVGDVVGLAPEPTLDVLDAAVRARVLVEPPGGFGFAHSLVREALLGPLSAARRARLHGLLAEALEARAARDPDRYLAALAGHALEATAGGGDPHRAAELAERAAARAGAILAHDDAAELLDRTVAMLERRGVGGARRAQALCALGEALQRAGRPQAAAAPLERASELARMAGRHDLLARATLAAGGLGIAVVEVDAPRIARLEECLAQLEPEHAELRVRVLARLAIELGYATDARRREQTSREAVELARTVRSPRALALALSARHVALWGPDHTAERLALAREIVELGHRAGDPELALQGRNWLIGDVFELGDGATVVAELEAYAALATEARLPAYSWWVPLWGATLALLDGRVEDGMALSHRARAQATAAGDPNALVIPAQQQLMRMVILRRFGDVDPAAMGADHLATLRARRGPAIRSYSATFAWVHAERGEVAAARRRLGTALGDGVATLPRDANWLAAMASIAQACARLGDAELARELHAALAPFADRTAVAARGALQAGSVAYLLARLAATYGDVAAAERHLEDAVRHDEAAGAPVWVERDRRARDELARVDLAGGGGRR